MKPAALSVLLTAFACGPSEPELIGDPLLELGTGDGDSFAPLPAEGGELPLFRGSQGGFHIELAVRIQGVDPEGTTLSYELRDGATGAALGPDGSFSLRRRRLDEQDGRWIRTGDRAVLDIREAMQVVGSTVRLSATLIGNGSMLEDEADARIVDG